MVLKYGNNSNIVNEEGSIVHVAIDSENEKVLEYLM